MRVRRRILVGSGFLAALAFGFWLRCGAVPDWVIANVQSESTIVVDRHGEVLYEARSSSGTRGSVMRPEDVPPLLRDATIAAEDARFRRHVGVDPIAIARAAWRNMRAGRIVEGGSTISQQVIDLSRRLIDGSGNRESKGGSGNRRIGWFGKLQEAVYALRLEHRFSKDEILARYLTLAPYGNQITGAARASEAYFGRSVASLTVAETAFLAALPQQPTRFNPWRRPDAARPRQRKIIAAMAERKWISAETAGVAFRERLVLQQEAGGTLAPHFVQRVLSASDRSIGNRRIETSLDAGLQRTVLGIIKANRESLIDHYANNVAVAVLDNRTGEWLAWEGSGDYTDQAHGGAIDGVTTPRQPGSALKPFTYAAAFERGGHPGRALADVPSHFPTAQDGILYEPRNYDGQYRGPLLARYALAGSENIPAVVLASEVGVPAVARMLRQSGFTTLGNNAAHYGLGLTLGNAEVRLDELMSAYAIIARGGVALDGTRVLSARTAFFLADILSDNEARAFIFGRGGSLEFPFPVAAKTGTSQAYRDNWAVGFTRDVTVGVWVGNFDRTPMRGSSGVTGAGPIFHEVMTAAVERLGGPRADATVIAPTNDVRRHTLCAMSGLAATDACPTRVDEWVPAGGSLGRCTWHHASDEGLITVWPEEYRGWAEGRDRSDVNRGSLQSPTANRSIHNRGSGELEIGNLENAKRLSIASPLAGATYLYDPTLRAEFQTLKLRARGAAGAVIWEINGERYPAGAGAAAGSGLGNRAIEWPLRRGVHEFVAIDESGARARTRVTVR
jgi:penicillin-binding protein 1C